MRYRLVYNYRLPNGSSYWNVDDFLTFDNKWDVHHTLLMIELSRFAYDPREVGELYYKIEVFTDDV